MWAVKSKSESNPFNNPGTPSPGHNVQIRSVNINLTNAATGTSGGGRPTPKAGILKNANQLHYSNQVQSNVSGSFAKNSGMSGISNHLENGGGGNLGQVI